MEKETALKRALRSYEETLVRIEIIKHDKTKEKKFYETINDMMRGAKRIIKDPSIKKVILWPGLKS